MTNAATEVADFLGELRPGGPWVLTAIVPDGKAITNTPCDEAGLREFIQRHEGTHNLYYSINPTRGALTKKAKKSDIAAVEFLQCDIDDADKPAVLDRLATFGLRPTVVVDSGNGIQALWRLEKPIRLNGPESIRGVEAANKKIIAALGGDRTTFNVDRIFRLPGTTNIPNKKKVEAGKVRCRSKLLEIRNEAYSHEAIHSFLGNLEEEPSQPGTPEDGGHHSGFIDLEDLIKNGGYERWNGDRSRAVFYVICEMVRQGENDAHILEVLLDRANRISDHIYDQSNPQAYTEKQLREALAKYPRGPLVPKTDHMQRARIFREARRENLHHWRDEFHDYAGGRYHVVADSTVNAELWGYLERARTRTKSAEGKISVIPFRPNRTSVAETVAALRAVGHIDPKRDAPLWLDGRDASTNLMSFPNGLLDVNTMKLMPPTPLWFSPFACGFDFDPNAPTPERWLTFLDEVFLGEQEQIGTLQELFGYCLTPDTSLQKAGLLLGPRRSGKGTIARVLFRLLASGTYGGPTLRSLEGEFGLQPLIGKQVIVISDMRIDRSRTNTALIAERLLSITGGDLLTVNRKFLTSLEMVLPLKIIILSNDLPSFNDDSGALASRFISLQTRQSFYDREDRELGRKLGAEIAGILLWALEGQRRLYQRGRFKEAETSLGLKSRMAIAASDVRSFVEERCTLNPEARVQKDTLYEQYRLWAAMSGHPPKDKSSWSNALLTIGEGRIKAAKLRDGERRVPHFLGIHPGPGSDDLPF